MKYKPSMFNRIVRKNDEMLLYNSKIGGSSVTIVPVEVQDKVSKWLSETTDFQENITYQNLLDRGFLVPVDWNEKAIRDFLRLNYITEPKLELVIHVTRDCNFRCTYCYMNFEPVCLDLDTQEGIVNFIRKNIRAYKSVLINWFGGEALLYPEIIENLSAKIIEICDKMKKPYSAVITTNGYLLSAEVADMLVRSRVNQFMITIDGINDLHDAQRMLADGSPTFDRIIENLLMVKSKIKTSVLSVIIRLNITKKHLPRMFECYNYFDQRFGDDERFSLFVRTVGDYGGERVKNMVSCFATNNDVANIYESIGNYKGKIKLTYNFKDLDYAGNACSARRQNKYTIGCDGSVYKCDEEVLGKPMGHLHKNGTLEIDINEFSKYMIIPMRTKHCDDCFFSNNCFMSGCPKQCANDVFTPCEMNFSEFDALIWLESKSYNVNELEV